MFKRAISLINIALFAALFAASLMLVRDAVSYVFLKKAPPAQAERTDTPTGEAKKTINGYEPLLRKNIFGLEGRGTLSTGAVSPSQTNFAGLTLIGTVTRTGGGSEEALGHAVFLRQGKEEIYKVGESVPEAGKLLQVGKNSVRLGTPEENAELEIIDITPQPSTSGRTRASNRSSGAADSFARKTSPGLYVLDRKAVDRSLANPRQILTDARLLPNMINGAQEGFSISEVKPGGIYHNLGLRNGDVLLSVNDFNISKPEAAIQAFAAIRGLDTVELDVMRGGRKMTLTYHVR